MDKQEENSPSATKKLLQLSGPKARTLEEFSLHSHDLTASLQLLEALNNKALSSEVRKGLWYHAITIFYKCFKHSDARRRLWPQVVFAKRPDLMPAYNFFLNLRDRHIVHDDNPYIKAYAGVIVSKNNESYTVEEIVSHVAIFDILDENKWRIFYALAKHAAAWAKQEKTRLKNLLQIECEKKTPEEIDSLQALAITIPTINQVSTKKEYENHSF